jgi:hypothetical protein
VAVAAGPQRPHRKAHPFRAMLFALIPGLGAVHNRQNLKALVHFVGVMGLMQMAESTDLAFFGVGAGVFYLFTLVDAFRTANSIAEGEDPREDEVRLRWMFSRYKPIWGTALCVLAVIASLASLPVLPFGVSEARLWALLLFVAGAALIVSYFRSLNGDNTDSRVGYDAVPPPRSVVSTVLPPVPNGYAEQYDSARGTSSIEK